MACMALSDRSTGRVFSSLSTLWPYDPCSHLIWQTDTFFNVISTYSIYGTTLNLLLDFSGSNCLLCQLPVGCIRSPRSLPFAVWSSQFWNFTVCPPTTLTGVCVPACNINYPNLNTWIPQSTVFYTVLRIDDWDGLFFITDTCYTFLPKHGKVLLWS